MDDERQQRSYDLAGMVVRSWGEAFGDAAITARGRSAWAEVTLSAERHSSTEG